MVDMGDGEKINELTSVSRIYANWGKKECGIVRAEREYKIWMNVMMAVRLGTLYHKEKSEWKYVPSK